jgi:putative transposase
MCLKRWARQRKQVRDRQLRCDANRRLRRQGHYVVQAASAAIRTRSAYGELLATYDVRQRVGRPGSCWDNAVAESFFSTLKSELIHRYSWPTRCHAESAIFEFISGWNNQHRRHSALDFFSPADVERRTSLGTLAA